jgi:hypothetical protein
MMSDSFSTSELVSICNERVYWRGYGLLAISYWLLVNGGWEAPEE